MRQPVEIEQISYATKTPISACAYKRDLGYYQTEYIVYDLTHQVVIDQFSIAYNNVRKQSWSVAMTNLLGKVLTPRILKQYKPVYGKRDINMVSERLKWISYHPVSKAQIVREAA